MGTCKNHLSDGSIGSFEPSPMAESMTMFYVLEEPLDSLLALFAIFCFFLVSQQIKR